jgi:protein-tyrosine phosphatase/arsenate reductase
MNNKINSLCESLSTQFDSIPEKRKEILEKITAYIQQRKDSNKPISLVYICTHNARRSFFGQIWAQSAAHFYGIDNCTTYSGGMEVTRCHPNAINALQNQGFEAHSSSDSTNPLYEINYGGKDNLLCFSKLFNDSRNPAQDFAAIMVCSDAETKFNDYL